MGAHSQSDGKMRTMRTPVLSSVACSCWLLLLTKQAKGFQQQPWTIRSRISHVRTATSLKVIQNENEPILDKTQRILKETSPPFDPQMDSLVKSIFPQALNNNDFVYRVVAALAEKQFTATNTLLATSLCNDELAKRLADDFTIIYGKNFNLGGLAGFPFAGNIGFQTMASHIPDNDGFCLLVYGPHVGVTREGTIGKVERENVSVNDICCRSAIEACNSVLQGLPPPTGLMDLQQGAVQNLVDPYKDRLQSSEYPMWELPYAIYESQNQLVENIVSEGISGIKGGGIALLGGIQINTGPFSLDYFHPLRFDLIDARGELVENMIGRLSS